MADFYSGQTPDIAGNIKAIERLKSSLLTDVSKVFAAMSENKMDSRDLNEMFAAILIDTYTLGKRLGLDYDQVDQAAINKLKVRMAADHSPNPDDTELCRRLKDSKNLQ